MKKLALLTLFLCLSFSFAGFADAELVRNLFWRRRPRLHPSGAGRLWRRQFQLQHGRLQRTGGKKRYRKYRPGFYQKPFYSQQMAQIQQPSDWSARQIPQRLHFRHTFHPRHGRMRHHTGSVSSCTAANHNLFSVIRFNPCQLLHPL